MNETIKKMLDEIEWEPTGSEPGSGDGGIPTVTHWGELDIGAFSIPVFQLDNGQRVVDMESLREMLLGDGDE